MSDQPYQDKLSPEAFQVCRKGATEMPFSGIYNYHWLDGIYVCACCERPLFDSKTKFNSGCGWPSFFQSLDDRVVYLPDHSHNMIRTEIKCAHLASYTG